jgi:hypothetical protein
MFVPWKKFLCVNDGDINDIWEREKLALRDRISYLVGNIQLLRRSAEDVKCDARQWAASSGEGDPTAGTVEAGATDHDYTNALGYRCDNLGCTARLIDVLGGALSGQAVIAGSEEVSALVGKLQRFQEAGLGSLDELHNAVVDEPMERHMAVQEDPELGTEIPRQEHVKAIKSQQSSVSREREKMIQGIQSHRNNSTTGNQDVHTTTADLNGTVGETGPSTCVQLGEAASFSEAGRQLSEWFILNLRQSIAFGLICRQLDRVSADESSTPQLCQFIGGEGGTGKSRIINAIAELFSRRGESHRLLITATSGMAAANINGVTNPFRLRVLKGKHSRWRRSRSDGWLHGSQISQPPR